MKKTITSSSLTHQITKNRYRKGGALKAKFWLACLTLMVFNLSAQAQSFAEVLKAVASDRGSGDNFGYSVDISGDYAIIGVRSEDEDASGSNTLSNAGSAYIFERDGSGNWSQVQKIVASDRAEGDYFGHDVAIDGDFAIVGAPFEDEDPNGNTTIANAGSAYIFERNGSGYWSQIKKLGGQHRSSGDNQGWSVDISGEYAIVGAWKENTGSAGGNTENETGSAFVYVKGASNTWNLLQKLVAPDRDLFDNFGVSVSISGDQAVIGAYRANRDVSGNNFLGGAGAAYVYLKSGSTFGFVKKLVPSDRAVDDYFGWSVSISGDYIAVGAYQEDEDESGLNTLNLAGSVYVFENSGGTQWSEVQKLVSSDRAESDYFGYALAISGDKMVVGAHQEDEDESGGNTLQSAGSCYLFERSAGGGWSQTQKIVSSDREYPDYFGNAVALSEDYLLVGAKLEDNGGFTAEGAAYFFEYSTNADPTDITFSSPDIAENNSINDIVGTLLTTDSDEGDSHTYSLVSGTGDTDNASFDISGSSVFCKIETNHEIKDSYSIRIETNDGNGGTYSEAFTISVLDIQEAPTNITVSPSDIDENSSDDTSVGAISVTDEDDGDTHTVTIVNGAGDDHNELFYVFKGSLVLREGVSHEKWDELYVRLKAVDGSGELFIEKEIVVTVNDVPEPPTNINLAGSSIAENMPAGTTIGTFSTTDPDAGESYTYSFVSGDNDNSSFSIVGSQLRSAEKFDFETKSSYSIRVNSNDGNGGNVARNLTISVTDVGGAPPAISTLSPEDEATFVDLDATLVINFDQSIQPGSGIIQIKNAGVGTTKETITIPSANAVFSGSTLTITPSADFFEKAEFYVNISDEAIEDTDGDPFAGIDDATTWNFSTRDPNDVTAPGIAMLSPANEATYVDLDTNLEITFDEDVEIGSGDIVIKRISGSFHETIDIEGGQVVFDAGLNKLTINPSVDLSNMTEYYVEFTSGAIEDLSGNEFSISGSTTWSFATYDPDDATGPVISGLNPADGATGIVRDGVYVVTFDEEIVKRSGFIRFFNGDGILRKSVSMAAATVDGNTMTIDPDQTFSYGEEINIRMDVGVVEDRNGNDFAGILDATTWNFTIEEEVDVTPPVITSSATRGLYENVEGDFYIASANEVVTFTLGTTKDEAAFSLNTLSVNTSGLSFVSTPDYENPVDANADNVYIIDLTATDASGNSATLEVTITVFDVDEEAPTITSAAALNVEEGVTGTIYTATANESVTFTLGDTKDESLFDLSTNQISFISSPDYDTPADGNGDNVYLIDVTATDAAGNSSTLEVEITVTELDDIAPTTTSFSPANGAVSVANDEAIVLTFSEPIQQTNYGNDFIRIRRVSNGETFHQIEPEDATQVTIDGNVVTIQPTGGIVDVEEEVQVYVHWTSTPFEDLAGNDFNDLFSASDYRFTVDNTPAYVEWTGTAWSNGSGPTSDDDVLISGLYTYFGNGAFECNDLIIASGEMLVVNVEGILEVNGDIENNGSIRITSGSSLITYEENTITGNDIEFRRITRYADGKYSFVGSPVEQNSSIVGSELGSSVYWYDETVAYGANEGLNRWKDASSAELVPGKGYTQAFKDELVFFGKPNTGTITYSGTYTEDTDDANEGWHLVSNPYPAAIFIDDFLDANMNTTDAIYIWDDNGSDTGRGSNNDYIVANKTAATDISGPDNEARWNFHIGSAQGFFVKLDGAAGDITFTEDMRVSGFNSDDNFFRKAETQTPLVRINLTHPEGLIRQAIVGWNQSVSNTELAQGYDANVFNNAADYLIYTMKADAPLTIQTVNSDIQEIPVGFSVAEAGQYMLEFVMENIGADLYLYDKEVGQEVALTNGSYSFYSASGYFSDRFVLQAASKALALDHEKVNIYAFNKVLHIETTGSQPAQYRIFNLSGVSVMNASVTGSTQIDLGHLSNGVYIVSDGIESKKIIIK